MPESPPSHRLDHALPPDRLTPTPKTSAQNPHIFYHSINYFFLEALPFITSFSPWISPHLSISTPCFLLFNLCFLGNVFFNLIIHEVGWAFRRILDTTFDNQIKPMRSILCTYSCFIPTPSHLTVQRIFPRPIPNDLSTLLPKSLPPSYSPAPSAATPCPRALVGQTWDHLYV